MAAIKHYITDTWTVSFEGTQYGSSAHHCSQPQRCTLRRHKMREPSILAPESSGAYARNEYKELRCSIFPYIEKGLIP